MGMGVGNSQPLAAQPGQQGGLGNSYVNPALQGMRGMMGGMPTPIQGRPGDPRFSGQTLPIRPPAMGGVPTLGNSVPMGGPSTGGELKGPPNFASQPGNLGFPDPRMQQPIQAYDAPAIPQQQLGAVNGTYRPAGSGAGLGSLVSGSSGSLNSMPSMGGSAGAGGSGGFNGGSGGPFPLQGQYGIVKMANGGLASAAQNMADQGRDGDSMLVHMSPGEVKGLQALAMAHGGSLSINPDTGLVEASFLKRILPMIAGAGLSMIPGVGPFMAAGMVGGFETMRTGDIGKGLMAGLGAYGGAGLTSSLAGAGATEATLAANPGVTGGEIAREMGTAGFNAPTMADKVGAGFNQITKSPEALGAFGKQNLMNIGAAAAPALGDAMTPKGPAVPGVEEEDPRYAGSPYRYNLASGFQGSTPVQPNPYYRPTGLGYAAGGLAGYAGSGAFDDEGMGDDVGMASGGIAGYAAGGNLEMKKMSLGDGIYRDTDDDTASLGAYDAAKKRMEKQYAAANIKAPVMPKSGIAKLGQMKAMAEGGLGSYSDGGRMLKGPGDGMSDDIPAVIGKKQPARLADGEFVVPADVVSHLGNGSTDAGAKKLYSMMDKVRTARTGKKKQAPAVKTDKYMPA